MNIIKDFANNTSFFLLVLISTSILFLFSLYSKLIGVETFEVSIYASGIPFKYSELVSRIVLIAEGVIGVWLLISLFTKDKIALTLSFLLLLFFDILLLKDIFFMGGKENCGCFGDLVQMSSEVALIKNIGFQLLMLPIVLFADKYSFKRVLIGLSLIVLISASIMIAYPIGNFVGKEEGKKLSFPVAETKLNELSQELKSELYVEDQFLVFAHYNCNHCKLFTNKLQLLSDQEVLKKCRIVLYGTDHKVQKFLDETKTTIPITVVEKEIHLGVCGGVFPSVFYYNNGSLIGRWSSEEFEPLEITKKYSR